MWKKRRTEESEIWSKRRIQSGRKAVKKEINSSSMPDGLSKSTSTKCLTPQLWRARIPEVYNVTGLRSAENTMQLSRCLVWAWMDDPSSIVVSLSRQRIKATEVILWMGREEMKIPFFFTQKGGSFHFAEIRKNLVLEVSAFLSLSVFI